VTGLGAGRLRDRVAIPCIDKHVSYPQGVQTGCGAHPVSYSISTGDSFCGSKTSGHEAKHSPPSSTEIRNGANHKSHHMGIWHPQDQLYLYR